MLAWQSIPDYFVTSFARTIIADAGKSSAADRSIPPSPHFPFPDTSFQIFRPTIFLPAKRYSIGEFRNCILLKGRRTVESGISLLLRISLINVYSSFGSEGYLSFHSRDSKRERKEKKEEKRLLDTNKRINK